MKYSFEPFIDSYSKVLILGTMPGEQSLAHNEYYANPKNQFWMILSGVFNQRPGSSYMEKLNFLQEHRLALWDVLQGAEREGSLDQNIRMEVPNDFSRIFVDYPSLKAVLFNGGKAEKYFQQLVLKQQVISRKKGIEFLRMPSSSPTPGKNVLPLPQKIEFWKILTKFI
jgi:hypoxanthine-DNA glycosylase